MSAEKTTLILEEDGTKTPPGSPESRPIAPVLPSSTTATSIKRRSGESPAVEGQFVKKDRPKSSSYAKQQQVKRQSYHQAHINRRNRQIAAGRSQLGGMASADMGIVQLANFKKQYITEAKQINAQRKRMKDVEKNVAELKKQEKGLGVKKANAKIAKLEDHLEKMTGLVMVETRERENAEKEVHSLTEEVQEYSKKYSEVCKSVEVLVGEKIVLERQVSEKKATFDSLIKKQEGLLNDVEGDLQELDGALKQDNMVRNRINDDKKMIESVLDKLRELRDDEGTNIETDKDFLLGLIKAIEVSEPKDKRASVSSMRAASQAGGSDSKFGKRGTGGGSTYLPAFYNTQNQRNSSSQMSATRFSILQGRESYKAKRESLAVDGPPSFLQDSPLN